MISLVALLSLVAASSTPITAAEVREQSRNNTQALLSAIDAQRAVQQVELSHSSIRPQVALRGGASANYSGPQRIYSTIPKSDGAGGVSFEQSVVDVPGSYRSSFDLSVTVQQLLYDGGKWWTQIEQAGALEEAARGQLAEQRLTSELEGLRRFYELYRAQKTLEVLEANAKRSVEQIDRAQALFDAGRAGKNDTLAAQVNLGNDRISVVRQRSRISSAQADLASWLARDAGDELVATETAPTTPPAAPSYAMAVQQAHQARPLLGALAKQVKSSELAITIVRAGYRPRVALSGTVGRQAPTVDPFFTDPSKQNYVSGGVVVQWDIFNGYLTDVQTQQAELQRSAATLNLAQATREIDADVKKALALLEANLGSLAIATENRVVAEQALALAEDRFKAGAGSTLDVRDAQLKLTQAELVVVESRVDVDIARAGLSRVLGEGVKP